MTKTGVVHVLRYVITDLKCNVDHNHTQGSEENIYQYPCGAKSAIESGYDFFVISASEVILASITSRAGALCISFCDTFAIKYIL
jgi:hypothetical protein